MDNMFLPKGLGECLAILNSQLESEEMVVEIQQFLEKASKVSKWMLYSDYCLDDPKKPNDVITFVLVPYLNNDEYQALDNKIKETQPKDMKKSRDVNIDFLSYIKQQAILSFSFIVNGRQLLYGNTEKEQIDAVVKTLESIKKLHETWRDSAENNDVEEYFKEIVQKLKRQVAEISQRKNVKIHMDILLITLLGAVYTAAILKHLPKLKIFGWFPDRDKTNEACDQIAVPIFNAVQYKCLNSCQYKFLAMVPNSAVVPFYDNENRIADIICATVADYNIKANKVSANKFIPVLRGLMADNNMMKVYRLHVENEKAHVGSILIYRSFWKDMLFKLVRFFTYPIIQLQLAKR